MKTISVIPAATASSTAYWINGLSTTGSISFGCALVAARATESVRDITQLLPFIFRLLLYASGVLFSVDKYTEGKGYAWVFHLNPVYEIVTLTRWSILGGEFQPELLLAFIAWTAFMSVVGLAWFRAGEGSYGRE